MKNALSRSARLFCAALIALSLVPAVFAESVDIDASSLPWDSGTENQQEQKQEQKQEEKTEEKQEEPDEKKKPPRATSGGLGTNEEPLVILAPPTETLDIATAEQPTEQTEEQPAEQTEEQPIEEEPVIIPSFSDVTEADWFYSDVTELASQGVINGYPDGTFLPEANVTRAEFLKLVVSISSADDLYYTDAKLFEDVDPDEWYGKYLATAVLFGYIDRADYGTTFKPDEAITRREVAKILAGMLKADGSQFLTPYEDTDDANAIALYGLCIMQGSIDPYIGGRYFYPDTAITRAEVSAVINRVVKLATSGNAYILEFKRTHHAPNLIPIPETIG